MNKINPCLLESYRSTREINQDNNVGDKCFYRGVQWGIMEAETAGTWPGPGELRNSQLVQTKFEGNLRE